jgi:uncharacterized LabA/DUF88 family protein
VIWRDVI